MPKTEIILTHNIVGLGAESDQVKVAAGYARNFLFPQRLAIPVTQGNRRHLEALRQRRAEREAHEFNTMTELSKALSKLICVIKVKAGEDGKMFGSVTAGMIADELKHQFDISLDKRKIHLEHPVRTLGNYEVELHLHAEVKGTLKVRVESTTPAAALASEATAAAAPAEARTEDGKKPRTEKRGFVKRDVKSEKTPKPEKAEKTEAQEAKKARAPKAEKTVKTPKADKKEKAE
jgi:large subunit ribosomal protein L9